MPDLFRSTCEGYRAGYYDHKHEHHYVNERHIDFSRQPWCCKECGGEFDSNKIAQAIIDAVEGFDKALTEIEREAAG